MRSSSKSRSRNKNNRNRSNPGNVVNRVFDSSGPEGKVRGTPQQIIDKYQTLARDAQLSGDRVAAENFLQHAEHYVRMLGEAQRDIEARREQQEQQRQQQQQNDGGNKSQGRQRDRANGPVDVGSGDQPAIPDGADVFPGEEDSAASNLVETPESDTPPAKPAAKPARKRAAPKPKPEVSAEEPVEEAKAAE
ncbi:MAG: DUF4167 domain-containing protein [Pseudomonadota bacterium]